MAKEKISAELFIEKINDPGNIVYLNDLEIFGAIRISGEFVNCDGLFIQDCVFTDILSITECTLSKDIVFEKCSFDNGINLSDLNVGFHERDRLKIINSISINSCTINQSFDIVRCKLQRRIHITKSNIQRLYLQQVITESDGVQIDKTTIEDWFDCNNLRLKGSLGLSKCTINTKTRLHDTHGSDIFLIENTFNKDLWIVGGLLERGVTFNDGQFNDAIILQAVNAKEALTIIGGNFKESFSVTYRNKTNNLEGSFQKIYIQSATFDNGLYVSDPDFINMSEIDEINIPFNAQLKGTISFNNLKVKTLKFSGTNFNSNISINNIQPQKVLLDRFSNYSDIQFADFRADQNHHSEFIINRSYLGKFQFLHANLNTFNAVRITNSHLSDIIAASVTWFDDEKLQMEGFSKETTIIENITETLILLFSNLQRLDNKVTNSTRKQEIYRQLKVAMEKHGNRIQSLKFKQLEMKYYGKFLMYTKKIWNQDRLIMISNLSNSHGKYWFKPVLLAIFITIPFYILLIVALSPEINLSPSCKPEDIYLTKTILFENFSIYLQLFNPARILSRTLPAESNLSINGYAHLIDIIQRIIIAFLIYQTIAAFRKYSKS